MSNFGPRNRFLIDYNRLFWKNLNPLYSIIIDYFCYFVETDNENPIKSIIIHETSVRELT